MKKTLSLILTVIILLSSFSLQSFAIFKTEKIEKVELASYEPVSLKEIRTYVDYFEDEELDEGERMYSPFCEFDVTLSSGEVVHIPEMDYGYTADGKMEVDAYAWVDVYECLEAAENGLNKAPLYIEATVCNKWGKEISQKLVKREIEIPERIVKSLTLVDGSIKFYKNPQNSGENDFGAEYLAANIDDLCFDIVYEDGTTVRANVEEYICWPIDKDYRLDGKNFFIYPDYDTKEKDVSIQFMDMKINLPAKIVNSLFEKIEIDEVIFDDEFNEKSVTFTVYDAKDNKKTITRELNEYVEIRNDIMIEHNTRVYDIGTLYGSSVLLGVEDTIVGEKYPYNEGKEVVLTVDGCPFANGNFIGPQVEPTPLERILEAIKAFFLKIIDMLKK